MDASTKQFLLRILGIMQHLTMSQPMQRDVQKMIVELSAIKAKEEGE